MRSKPNIGENPVSGASGASSTGATQPAPSDPSAAGATTGAAHTPPAGLPPEVTTVAQGTRSVGTSDDAPACTVVRVRGQRVQFSDESSLLAIKRRVEARGGVMNRAQEKQAELPAGAEVLPNSDGTAPGFAIGPGGRPSVTYVL